MIDVAVIGAGPLGLSVAHELVQQGLTDFRVFEGSDDVGGTWHLHSYPGLACDVWAHSYTFPWARNPDWSANFVDQSEIEAYIQRTAREKGLTPYVRLNTAIARLEYQSNGSWKLESESGEVFEARSVVSCIGNQFTPLMPAIEGLETFKGEAWHSTHWRHDVDLKGKKVAVIGSAAAAVQIVPEVAKQAAELTVFQRTANWIMPRNKKEYSEGFKRAMNRFPWLNEALVWGQGQLMKLVHKATTLGHKRMEQFEATALKFIDRAIDDPELRKAVTPKTRYGCKRPLVSDDFYPALNLPHVNLIPEGVTALEENAVIAANGRRVEVDAIVFATGYRVLDFDRVPVIGRNGRELAKQMAEAPEAYKGMAVPGFPNFFFGIGPNGVALTVSYFITAHLNAQAIVRVLKQQREKGLNSIEIDEGKSRQYNDWMIEQFPKFSWGNAACQSYYRSPTGHVPFLYPDDFKRFKNERESFSLEEFQTQL